MECKIIFTNTTLFIKSINNDISYNIYDHLGSGTVGNVYLLESFDSNKYVIKVSKNSCKKDLMNELDIFQYLKKNEINNKIFPLYYGDIEKSDKFGIIYPFLGKYNFDKFKIYYINKLSFNNNIDIIKQIIEQLISFDNIIHCDLKSSNIIIEINENKLIATLTDLGLSNLFIPDNIVVSTSYITSPESLLTNKEYKKCIVNKNDMNIKKHDYFGLFCFIINLFIKKYNYWDILSFYLVKLDMNISYLVTPDASSFFVYIWYKFNNSICNNLSLKEIISKIESNNPYLLEMDIINFETFFKVYITPKLNYLNEDQIILLYDFLSVLIKFDPIDRPDLDILLQHSFLQNV
jgi:serine/threonine protein kinase